VNQQDKQAIEDLFQHLNQTVAQGGPRDRDAEALIQQHVQQGPPGLLYHMAQTLVGQQGALRQMRAQLADCQQQLQQSGSQGGFLRGWRGGGQRGYGGYGGYGPPPYQQPSGWQRGGGGGFLAGAGQIALGVGGGILAAEALGNLFSGEPLFGGDRDYDDRGDSDDRGDGDDRGDSDDRGGDQDYGDGGYQDYGDGGYQDTGYDDGGGFDDGGGW
jgi:uncharacterized protein